jgi:hypothetical protein
MATCSERMNAEKARLEAMLANPQALQAQADKLRSDLRQYRAQLHSQLVALVTQGHSLAKAVIGGAVPSNFSEQVEGLKKNVDAVRVSYAYFFSRGEEKELSSVASRMSTALVDADGIVKPERYFAAEVAGLQAEMKRSKFQTPSRLRYFQDMQAQHQESQRQLAIHQDTLSKIIGDPVVLALDLPG